MHLGRSILALSLLSASAQAQYFYQHRSTYAWPGGANLSPLKHPVAGHFIDASETDVCFLANGAPTLYVSPESIGISTPISTTSGEVVNDLVTVPLAGSNGTDGLATVGSEGLRLRTYSTALHDFAWSALSSHSNWLGAKAVRCGDLDGTGTLDYVGVGSTGTFLVCRFNGGAPAPRFTVPNTILDLQLVQWDTDTAKEIAVLTTWGVYVYESSGTLDASFARPGGSGGQIAVVHIAGQTKELVEWLSPALSSGNPSLYEIAQGVGSPTFVTALAQNFVKLVADDMPLDGTSVLDGNTDLMMFSAATCAPTFFRQGSSPRFSNGVLVDPAPAQCETWWPKLSTVVDDAGAQDLFFGDLTGDGMPDLLVGVGLTMTQPPPLNTVTSTRIEYLRCGNNIPPLPIAYTEQDVWQGIALGDPAGGNRDLHVKVRTDKNLLPAGTVGANATHVEFSLWSESRNPTTGAITLSNNGEALFRRLIPLDAQAPFLDKTCLFSIPQSSACFGDTYDLYWVQVRYVNWNGMQTSPVSLAGGAFLSYVGTDIPMLESCAISGQSVGRAVFVPKGWLSTVQQNGVYGSICQTGSAGPGCAGSNSFVRGPGHANRSSIRRDNAGTIPTPKPTPEQASSATWPTNWQ